MTQTARTDEMTAKPRTGPGTIGRAVIEILAAQALRDPDGITSGDRIEDLGIDSLGMAEVIFAIEERFDVAVPFNGAETDARGMELDTVAGVIAAVEALVASETPAPRTVA
jgi:acyl carrier protein